MLKIKKGSICVEVLDENGKTMEVHIDTGKEVKSRSDVKQFLRELADDCYDTLREMVD